MCVWRERYIRVEVFVGVWSVGGVGVGWGACEYTRARMSVCVHIHINVCVYPRINVCVYPRINVSVYPRINVCVYPRINVCVYARW